MIQVIGRIGSGKTYVARKIAEALNWDFLEVSEIVSKIIGKSKEEGRRDLQEALKGREGSNILLEEIRKHIVKEETVLCGSREPWHVYNLNKLDKNPFVVKVIANDYSRYIRTCNRDGYITPRQFEEMNLKDNDLGMDILMSIKENFAIYNDLNLKTENFQLRLDFIVKTLQNPEK